MEKQHGRFVMGIKDNGKGIATKEQTAIFDKFYRIEKGNIHETKGLGLGLFYVKQLVESYKGTIKVESEEDKGALFLITIPS
ncbi:Sensor protein kinase WalK [compost metagenome]